MFWVTIYFLFSLDTVEIDLCNFIGVYIRYIDLSFKYETYIGPMQSDVES